MAVGDTGLEWTTKDRLNRNGKRYQNTKEVEVRPEKHITMKLKIRALKLIRPKSINDTFLKLMIR